MVTCLRVVAAFALSVPLCASHAWAQFGRPPANDYVKTVDYKYNGLPFQFRLMGGEVRQVLQGGKVLLMVSAGTIMVFPGADVKAAGVAQDALKAYQASQSPGPGVASGQTAAPQSTLTVDGIVTMLGAGISQDIVIERVRKSGQPFDLSPEEMVRLKQANASDDLLKAMMASSPASAPAAVTSAPEQAQTPASQPGVTFNGANEPTVVRADGITVAFSGEEIRIAGYQGMNYLLRHEKVTARRAIRSGLSGITYGGTGLAGSGEQYLYEGGSMIFDSGVGLTAGNMALDRQLLLPKQLSVIAVDAIAEIRKVSGHEKFSPPGYSDLKTVATYKLKSDGSQH